MGGGHPIGVRFLLDHVVAGQHGHLSGGAAAKQVAIGLKDDPFVCEGGDHDARLDSEIAIGDRQISHAPIDRIIMVPQRGQ